MSNIDKNNAIREAIRATRIKRKSQTCKTFKFKIDKSSLSKSQSEVLKMFFIETKRIYNYLLNEINNGKDLFTYNYKDLKHIKYYDKDKNTIDYNISYIGSSVISDIITLMKDSIKGLSASKKNGNKVGALKFKSECNRVRLRQYGITHSIRGNRIKIQGIKTPIRVNGIKQLYKYDNIEYTTADILYDGYDYFISLTCYIDKEYKVINNNIIGIDFGCSTTITTSDGEKINISIEESDRLKGLQRKLSNQVKRSNNWYKTRSKIRKEYNRMNNKKNDISNKIIHKLISNYGIIVIQNDQISEWKDDIKSKTIQHSILGRLKSKLSVHDQVVILDQWFPTTKYCFNCDSINDISLADRIYKCPNCGYQADRDVHAAKNMIDFYMKYKSVGTPDSKPIKKVSYIRNF